MKCLVVVDIVSYSKKIPAIMPGFDYVHGLQGFAPRTYEENIEIFKEAQYDVLQEINAPNMPNTFMLDSEISWMISKSLFLSSL